MPGKVFVFGSINTDLVVYVQRLPRPGETVSRGTYASYPGGKGANQAVAAARAGASAEIHGCLGDDLFGRERMASLEGTGVSTRGVRIVPGAASGVAQITVDAGGENTIAVAPGANERFGPEGVEIPACPTGETWVSLFQNEVPQETTERLIRRAHEAGHLVIWNLAPTLARRPSRDTLRCVGHLVCNLNELYAFLQKPPPSGAGESAIAAEARHALDGGVRSLIVTRGRRGSLWLTQSGTVSVPAFRVDAVDTVGAGDCFCGVLAASLSAGRGVGESLRRASAAAAISVTRRGAQPSMPTGAEIEEFLRQRGG